MSQGNPPLVPPSASSTPAIPSATSSTIPPAAAQAPPLPPLRLNIFDRVRNNAARFAALAASATGTTGASTPGQASPVSLGPGSMTSLQSAGPPLVPTGETTSTPARAAPSAAPPVSSTAAPGSGKLTGTSQADDFDKAAIEHALSSRPAVQPPPSAPPPASRHQVFAPPPPPPPPPVAPKETNGSNSAQRLTFKKIVPAANASTGGGSVAMPRPAGGASPRVSTGGNLNGSGGHTVRSDSSFTAQGRGFTVATSSKMLPKSSVPPKVATGASAPALSQTSPSTASLKFNKKLPQFRKINTNPPSSGSQPSSSSSSPVSARPIVAPQSNTPRPSSAGTSSTGPLAVAEGALPRSEPAFSSPSVALASSRLDPDLAEFRGTMPRAGPRVEQEPRLPGMPLLRIDNYLVPSPPPVSATANTPSPLPPSSAPKDVAPVASASKAAPVVVPSTNSGEKSGSEPEEPLIKSYDHRRIFQSTSETPPVVPAVASTTAARHAAVRAASKQGEGFKKRSRVVLSDSDSEASELGRPLAQRRTSGTVIGSTEKGSERAEEGRPSSASDRQQDGAAPAQGQTATDSSSAPTSFKIVPAAVSQDDSPRATANSAVSEKPARIGAVPMSDSDDDEPLGAILKATSQSASPQRPVATRETVVPAQPKADAGKMTPPSSTTSINPVIDPFVRAPSVMVASLPERAPAPPPPADEDSDDEIIFVEERPPGHKLQSSKPAFQPVKPVSRPWKPLAEATPVKTPASRTSLRQDPPSSDPLNIHHTRSVDRSHLSSDRSPPRRHSPRWGEKRCATPDPPEVSRAKRSRTEETQSAQVDEEDRVEEPGSDDMDVDESEDDELLRLNRDICEKCEKKPAADLQEALERRRKRGGRKRKTDGSSDADVMSEGEAIDLMGGWVECERCCVSVHFGCLSSEQRTLILRRMSKGAGERKVTLELDESASFLCGRCVAVPACFSCGSSAMQEDLGKEEEKASGEASTDVVPTDGPRLLSEPGPSQPSAPPAEPVSNGEATPPTDPDKLTDGAGAMDVDKPGSPANQSVSKAERKEPPILFFRCWRCKRGVHYCHLRKPAEWKRASVVQIAQYYQDDGDWFCHDCIRLVFDVDKIIAWRPSPATAVEPSLPPDGIVDYRKSLPREYLVKWAQLGFRHVEWVPHQWLLATSKARLRNFLAKGSQLAPFLHQLSNDAEDENDGSLLEVTGPSDLEPGNLPIETVSFTAVGPPVADPLADSKIPNAWKTIDRVLTVWMKKPSKKSLTKKNKPHQGWTYNRDVDEQKVLFLQPGLRPDDNDMVDIEEWSEITGIKLDERALKEVVWVYVKWEDLPYSESTYDTPPSEDDKAGCAAFKEAWRSYLLGLSTIIPVLTDAEVADRELRRKEKKPQAIKKQPSCVVGGTLMDFQMQGLNWLYHQWYTGQSCILADDMGLGKTVQIAALVGVLKSKHVYPCLIVVPNSTISNWMREFKKWIPDVRCAAYYGEKANREIIETYELFHEEEGRDRRLKVHCVITTYEAVTQKSFNDTFRRVPRWEMLVADEGQRLKNDASKIVKSLGTLNVAHRVLLTGTPLNNNIRELFNLMNFLDPDEWNNLDELEAQYESVTSENLAELRERLKPYFLRRVKAEVLKLPPKHEVIVPLSMRSLQREVYRGLMLSNADLIQKLVGNIQQRNKGGAPLIKKQTNLSNLMMQLRKTCAHPYLNQEDIENTAVGAVEMHKRLTEASAKLCFLKLLLPKLFQRGHRILLFSGFVIALDILADWLDGERISFFRLDGNTPQAQRQKDIDAFNAPNAGTSIFILSTRAGGVGINLASADTVIMFDHDFNPHQDVQAIARSYRFGQKKKVMVFKLMIRDSVEEKIVERGRKKMVLNHLIIQDMAKEEETDVESLILFGAKALFADEETVPKAYTSEEVDGMIEQAEKAEETVEVEAGGFKFGYAEVYDGGKEGDETAANVDVDEDFWDAIVKRAAQEKAEREEAGRGARRAKNAIAYTDMVDSPPRDGCKPPGKEGSPSYDPGAASSLSSDSEFEPPPHSVHKSLSSGPDSATTSKSLAGKTPSADASSSTRAPIAGPGPSTAPRPIVSKPPPLAKGPSEADSKVFTAMRDQLIKLAGDVDVDILDALQAVTAPTTTSSKRKDFWDLSINCVIATLEVLGLASSVDLQPLLRGRKHVHNYLDALPQADAAAPSASKIS